MSLPRVKLKSLTFQLIKKTEGNDGIYVGLAVGGLAVHLTTFFLGNSLFLIAEVLKFFLDVVSSAMSNFLRSFIAALFFFMYVHCTVCRSDF